MVNQKAVAGSMNMIFFENCLGLEERLLVPEAARQEVANCIPASLNQVYGSKSSSAPKGTCICAFPGEELRGEKAIEVFTKFEAEPEEATIIPACVVALPRLRSA